MTEIKLSLPEFQRISFIVTNEKQAGWHPTRSELIDLIHSDRHPSKMIQKDMKNLDHKMEQDAS